MNSSVPDPRSDSVEFSRAVASVGGTREPVAASGGNARAGSARRPFLQVWFRCSGHYQRVYRSADGTSYQARCPKCAKQVRFRVGPGGTGERFFQVHCDER